MKIALITNRFIPAIGGVENVVFNQAHELSKNHEVVVFASNQTSNNRNNSEDITSEAMNIYDQYNFKVNLIPSKYLPFSHRYYVGNIFKHLIKLEADIIHIHGMWYFFSDITIMLSDFLSKKAKIFWNPHFYQREGLKWKIYSKLLSYRVKNYSLIFVSNFEYTNYSNYMNNKPPKIIISHGVNEQEFNDVKYNYYSADMNDVFKIIFIGRHDTSKGIDLLIEIAKKLKNYNKLNVKIILIGPDLGYSNILESKMREFNLESIIIPLGRLKREDLISCLKNSDIFIFPSRYEAFGIALIEAMIAKVPILAMKSSAIPETLGHGKFGHLFEYENVDGMYHLLIKMIEESKFRNQNVLAAYEHVSKNLNWENIIEKLVKYYEGIGHNENPLIN